jgi:diacylglycerol O-acyltransferase
MEDMTGLDARFLYSETPTAHMHTMKIAVVDVSGRERQLTPPLFVELLTASLDRMPGLRRRVVEIPHRLGHPVWVEDPDLDVPRHVRWRVARPPGDDRELARIVAEVAATPLPRHQPLWELTVVEGLTGGRIAFVVKIHHAVADGGAAVAMLENAFLATRQPPHQADDQARDQARDQADDRAASLPSTRALYARAVRSRARRVRALPAFARRTGAGLVAARRTRHDVDHPLAHAFSSPRTSLNVSLDPARTFAMTTLSLEEVMTVKQMAGVRVNDVFLAVCGGALRRYLLRRDELPATSLVAGVPLATHVGEHRLTGNHMDNLYLALGTDEPDAAVRLQAIHRSARGARKVRDALGPELFEYRAGLTPPHLYPLGLRLWARTRLADHVRPPINLVASNVAGPRTALALEGGVVTALYSVGPILEGIGLNITAWSYVDALHVSLLGCPSSLPDPWVLADDLEAALAELVDAFPG